MGKRGPKPTPTAILKLNGSWRANTRPGEPVATGRAECPEWIGANARAVWEHIAPQLERMGTLAQIDENALTRYCVLFARWAEAERTLDEKGSTYDLLTEEGEIRCVQQRPEVAIAHKLAATLTKIEAEFGMTPAARSGIHLPPAEDSPHNELVAFVNAKR